MSQKTTFESIFKAESLQELKKVGKLNEIRKAVADHFGFKIPGKGRGWKGYFDRIQELKSISDQIRSNGADLYFKSESAKYIFALTEVDGQARRRFLGVTSDLYRSNEEAKRWRDHIAKLIHPDKIGHQNAESAFSKLDELYKSMTE